MRINLQVILRHFKCWCKVTINISNTQIFFVFFIKNKNRRAEARLFEIIIKDDYWIEPVPALKSRVIFLPAVTGTAAWSPPTPR